MIEYKIEFHYRSGRYPRVDHKSFNNGDDLENYVKSELKRLLMVSTSYLVYAVIKEKFIPKKGEVILVSEHGSVWDKIVYKGINHVLMRPLTEPQGKIIHA